MIDRQMREASVVVHSSCFRLVRLVSKKTSGSLISTKMPKVSAKLGYLEILRHLYGVTNTTVKGYMFRLARYGPREI